MQKTDIKTKDRLVINGTPAMIGFNPRNVSLLVDKGRSYVCAFDGTVGSRDYFHIRELYEEYGELRPGKGVSVPLEKKGEFLSALDKYIKEA